MSDPCKDYETIAGIIKGAINLICYAIPIIIIVLTVIDVAKVATSGNVDDKLKKETGQKAVTRLIYAVVVFLVPTIVSLIFTMLTSSSGEVIKVDSDGQCNKSFIEIYNNAGKKKSGSGGGNGKEPPNQKGNQNESSTID